MKDFDRRLAECCEGRVCLVGVGNPDLGDDAFGIRLAEAISEERLPEVEILLAGTEPERFTGRIREGQWSHVILLDAVDIGEQPGAVALLDSAEMSARFPQFSTHRISLGLLALYLEAGGKSRAWLLGVQPASLAPGSELSAPVDRAVRLLAGALSAALGHNRLARV